MNSISSSSLGVQGLAEGGEGRAHLPFLSPEVRVRETQRPHPRERHGQPRPHSVAAAPPLALTPASSETEPAEGAAVITSGRVDACVGHA